MAERTLTPIFLISLPRSGSTLLQGILATSKSISTTSEPWIALPLAYMRSDGGVASEYWHETCRKALDDLVLQFPNKEDDFNELCREFMLGAYGKLSTPESNYFLDKTPRYYLIAQFLERVFPDAIFIYLFRHPLDVLSSVFNTWHKRGFTPNLRGSIIDLWQGPELLVKAYEKTSARKFKIHYEDLTSNPTTALQELASSLQLELSGIKSGNYQFEDLPGRMGDPTLGKKYNGIAKNSVGGWKSFVTNSYRKAFVRDYVEHLPNAVLETLRVQRSDIMSEIDQLKCGISGSARDFAGYKWMQVAIWAQHLHPIRPAGILPPRNRKLLPLG